MVEAENIIAINTESPGARSIESGTNANGSNTFPNTTCRVACDGLRTTMCRTIDVSGQMVVSENPVTVTGVVSPVAEKYTTTVRPHVSAMLTESSHVPGPGGAACTITVAFLPPASVKLGSVENGEPPRTVSENLEEIVERLVTTN